MRQADLEEGVAGFRADAVHTVAVAAGSVGGEAEVVAEGLDLELEHAGGMSLFDGHVEVVMAIAKAVVMVIIVVFRRANSSRWRGIQISQRM